MTPVAVLLFGLLGAGAGYAILYYVIAHAVAAGILEADRRRQLAEAERQQTIAARRRAAGP